MRQQVSSVSVNNASHKHCIIPTQKLPSDLWAHQNIFTPTTQLKFSQLHMMIKPVQYAAETRAFFAQALTELRFLVSRVRSWQCLSTCASIRCASVRVC